MSRFPNKPIFQAKLVGGKFIMGNVRATRPFQNQTRNVVINNRITTAQNVVAGSVTVVDKPKKRVGHPPTAQVSVMNKRLTMD